MDSKIWSIVMVERKLRSTEPFKNEYIFFKSKIIKVFIFNIKLSLLFFTNFENILWAWPSWFLSRKFYEVIREFLFEIQKNIFLIMVFTFLSWLRWAGGEVSSRIDLFKLTNYRSLILFEIRSFLMLFQIKTWIKLFLFI